MCRICTSSGRAHTPVRAFPGAQFRQDCGGHDWACLASVSSKLTPSLASAIKSTRFQSLLRTNFAGAEGACPLTAVTR